MSVTITLPAWALAAIFTFVVTIGLLLALSYYFADPTADIDIEDGEGP